MYIIMWCSKKLPILKYSSELCGVGSKWHGDVSRTVVSQPKAEPSRLVNQKGRVGSVLQRLGPPSADGGPAFKGCRTEVPPSKDADWETANAGVLINWWSAGVAWPEEAELQGGPGVGVSDRGKRMWRARSRTATTCEVCSRRFHNRCGFCANNSN